jgi:hypothetical protein
MADYITKGYPPFDMYNLVWTTLIKIRVPYSVLC